MLMYYLFCCFLCGKHTKNQEYTDLSVVAKIKKNIKQLKKKKINDDLKTIYAMVQLLKKDRNAIRYLKKIRINPKLNRMSNKKHSTKLRSDLEFFLPQIISHYLRDDLTKDEEAVIVDFIMKGCELNIFFAHRVWFNLKASLVNKDNQAQVMKILSLLSELEVLVLKSQEKLYIANSDALVKLITKTNLDNMLSPECLLMQQQEELESQNGKASRDEQQSKYSANYFMSLFSNPKSGGSKSRSNIALGSISGKDQQALTTESRY